MGTNSNTQQCVIPVAVTISRAQAIELINALVVCFGSQSFSLTGVLAHRIFDNVAEISRFMFDELEGGVKVALSMAVKPRATYVSTAVLDCAVRRIIGGLQEPIVFRIEKGSYHKFDPKAPLK